MELKAGARVNKATIFAFSAKKMTGGGQLIYMVNVRLEWTVTRGQSLTRPAIKDRALEPVQNNLLPFNIFGGRETLLTKSC